MPYVLENLKNSNLGWLYYKYYYEESDQIDLNNEVNNRTRDNLANRNETILKRCFKTCDDAFSLNTMHSFPLKISYPGLLIGSGYTHEAVFDRADDKNEALKIGFFFDHTSGMPCLPGHSIKGALRAAFPNHKHEKYIKAKSEFIVDTLKKLHVDPEKCFNEYLSSRKISGASYSDLSFVLLLGEIIFEGQEPYRFQDGRFLYTQIPLHKKDIFHDAFIGSAGKDGFFLATDYITHHGNPLKNPNPVKFLKILPEVNIQFQFDLKDGLLAKEQKLELFRHLLLDFGIGAKTNVGYGQFEEGFANPSETGKTTTASKSAKTDPSEYKGKVKEGLKIEAVVIDSAINLVQATINGEKFQLKMATRNCPEVGSIVLVEIKAMNKKKEILLVGFIKQL